MAVLFNLFERQPWQHGIEAIASASRKDDHGFKSRQGVGLLGIFAMQCCCKNLKYIFSVYVFEKNKFFKNIIKKSFQQYCVLVC
jgi:hypothetical protein